MNHELKAWPRPFEAIWAGQKRYEIRKNDRGFEVGDQLTLSEFDPHAECNGSGLVYDHNNKLWPCACRHPHGTYTGREVVVKVTYMTKGGEWGLPDGLCVMSTEELTRQEELKLKFERFEAP